MVGASVAEGTAVVLLGHRDQKNRVSDHRTRRLPCAAGIEHSAHYAAAAGGGQLAHRPDGWSLADRHRAVSQLRIMSGRYV
jgi:hypothetical protein